LGQVRDTAKYNKKQKGQIEKTENKPSHQPVPEKHVRPMRQLSTHQGLYHNQDALSLL
jgi:hypothetical protein